jgi:hypothetical protein
MTEIGIQKTSKELKKVDHENLSGRDAAIAYWRG